VYTKVSEEYTASSWRIEYFGQPNPGNRLPTLMSTNIKLPSGVSSGNGGQCDRRLSVRQTDELQSGKICVLDINQG